MSTASSLRRRLAPVLVLLLVAAATAIMAGRAQSREGDRVIAGATTAVVQTEYGKVRGYVRDGIYTYKGIQYAQADRFMPPAKPAAWEGVRTALSDVKVCPIPRPTLLSDEIEFAQAHHWGFETEDCLRLNVWTPSIGDGRRRPVMVWLHGGGYSGGSSIELPFYDGENLARTGDVVVVSINHRLNILGFLNLAAYGEKYKDSANVGMRDVVASLEWVRGNIAAFGGDPANVTVFGQSGGGGKVTTLLYAPSAKGLLHKAISESGPTTSFGTRDVTARVAAEVLSALQIDPARVDELQKVPYARLIEAGQAALQKVRGSGWGPSVDGSFLTFQPTDAGAAPWSRDVPLVIGSNKFEFLVTTSTPALRTANEADAAAWAHQRYGDRADAYIAAVRKAWPDDRRPSTIVDLDTRMRPGVIRQASLKARAGGAPVYTYVFAWEAPVDDGLFKTMHCMEIPFVFNSIDRALMQTGGSKDAYALATAMSGAWVQFARTGKPGHARLPQWPAYTPETGSTMIFNTTSQVRQNHDADLIKAVEGS
jgi:para-nitrobenzyl esterase